MRAAISGRVTSSRVPHFRHHPSCGHSPSRNGLERRRGGYVDSLGGAGSVLNARSSRHALLSGKAAKLPRFAASLLVAVVGARCETRRAWALRWLRTACVHREVGTRLLPATLRHLVRGQAAVDNASTGPAPKMGRIPLVTILSTTGRQSDGMEFGLS